MENKHKEDIIMAIGKLQGKVDTGFKGVHARQDTANHRTEKLEDRVGKLETTDASILANQTSYKGFDKRIRYAENKIWYIIGIGVATASIFGLVGLGWFNAIQENITNNMKTAVDTYIESKDFELLDN